jgi:hypothetical protein
MARQIIYVLSHSAKWKFKCDHCGEDINETQTDPIKAAKKHVGSLPQGTLSQILIQGQGGQWQAEWTYGKDPFPPAG